MEIKKPSPTWTYILDCQKQFRLDKQSLSDNLVEAIRMAYIKYDKDVADLKKKRDIQIRKVRTNWPKT